MPSVVFTPKTKEQVEEEIKRAEEFAKEHPTSMFGDDNVHKVAIFKRLYREYLNGRTIEQIRTEVWDDAEDLDDDDEDEEEDMFGADDPDDPLDLFGAPKKGGIVKSSGICPGHANIFFCGFYQ